MTVITAVVVAALVVGFHFGSGHAHWRHQRNGCAVNIHRRANLWWSLTRGPWVSLPLFGGLRIGGRL